MTVQGNRPAATLPLADTVPKVRPGAVHNQFRIAIIGNYSDDRLDAMPHQNGFHFLPNRPIHHGTYVVQTNNKSRAHSYIDATTIHLLTKSTRSFNGEL